MIVVVVVAIALPLTLGLPIGVLTTAIRDRVERGPAAIGGGANLASQLSAEG